MMFDFSKSEQGSYSTQPQDTLISPRMVKPAGIEFEVEKCHMVDISPGLSLKKRKLPPLETLGVSEDICSVTSQSDLKSGVYEGGFKLWECAEDLIEFLHEIRFDFTGKRVLELGCGHGLPAVYALKCGCEAAVFQDLNTSVLTHATIPNVRLNLTESQARRAQFCCGDWRHSQLAQLLSNSMAVRSLVDWVFDGKFDIILSSDTLYSVEYMDSLIGLLKKTLGPGGCAYFAAKRYYFGVGGGVSAFSSKAATSGFSIESIRVIEDGGSNIREILEIRF